MSTSSAERRRLLVGLITLVVLAAACGTDPGARTERADAGRPASEPSTTDAPTTTAAPATSTATTVALAVGRFTTVGASAMAPDPVAVTVAVHDGIDDPARYLDQVVGQLEAIAQRYGPCPWPAYVVSVTAGLSGGIEFPMHVLQGPDTADRTTPHEVAHMWFYGLVGNNQALHPYLGEGIAT